MKTRLLLLLVVWVGPFFGAGDSLSVPAAFADKAAERPLKMGLKALQQMQALREEKALRTPSLRKLDSRLIYASKMAVRDPLVQRVPTLRSPLEVAPDNTTLVDMKARVTPSVLGQIRALGGSVVSAYIPYNAIRARMPLDQMESLAEHGDIRFIEPAVKAFTNKVNTSEADDAHNAVPARTAFGAHGRGVKIGVLSDSVDHLADVQATGDVPAVTVLEDFPGLTGEGTALLELVYDLAPEAELYFATAWNGPAGFATNIQALRTAGCHIIVDDVGYLNESPFQDDIISQAVNTVTADGALYFSSAGNGGNLNDGQSGVWEGNSKGITDGSLPGDLGTMTVHDFGGGDTTNRITTDPPFGITLFWADPLGASSKDYDLYLLNPAGDEIWAASTNLQSGAEDPYEYIGSGPWNDTDNLLVISGPAGDDNRFLHLDTNRGRLEHGTTGQIKGHPAAADAFALAAVGAQGRTTAFDGTESVETFSSDGPRRVFYEADGTPITPENFSATGGEVRQKPDLTAADGVAVATSWFNPFYGTSASAAHGAALAGLVLSAEPSLTAEAVRTALTRSALDIEAAGWDRDSGAGIVMADRALLDIGLFVRPLTGFATSGREGGPFATASKEYTLENRADSAIDWEVTHGETWVTLSSPEGASGTLGPGESITVTVSINANANSLAKGSHTDTVHIANTTRNYDVTRPVKLNVGPSQSGVRLLLLSKNHALHQ